jgi:hypothetical protein
MRSSTQGAVATALYDTFNTARLSEHPEEVEAYRHHALTFDRWLRAHGFRIVPK